MKRLAVVAILTLSLLGLFAGSALSAPVLIGPPIKAKNQHSDMRDKVRNHCVPLEGTNLTRWACPQQHPKRALGTAGYSPVGVVDNLSNQPCASGAQCAFVVKWPDGTTWQENAFGLSNPTFCALMWIYSWSEGCLAHAMNNQGYNGFLGRNLSGVVKITVWGRIPCPGGGYHFSNTKSYWTDGGSTNHFLDFANFHTADGGCVPA